MKRRLLHPDPEFSIIEDPNNEPPGGGSSEPSGDISDEQGLAWAARATGKPFDSLDGFKSVFEPQTPVYDEETRARLELASRIDKDPFVKGIVDFSLQEGGSDRLDSFLSVMRVAQNADDRDKLSDLDAIAYAEHLSTGMSLEMIRDAKSDELGLEDLEDESLPTAKRHALEYKLQKQAADARKTLKELAEQYKKTPETRDADAARVAQNAQRLAGWKPVVEEMASKLPAIEETVEVTLSNKEKMTVPFKFDLTKPDRAAKVQDIVKDIVAQMPNHTPETEAEVVQAARALYIGYNFNEVVTAIASELAGNAEIAASAKYHEARKGRPDYVPPGTKTHKGIVIQGDKATYTVSDTPFDDED